jgi:predicted nuclease of predicted toxin-antitoxin system
MILVDANLTPFWVEFLQSAGIEAVHWWRVGRGDAPDSELLEWAFAASAVILTGDGDFSQMIALRGLNHPSVIYLRTKERNPDGPGERVASAYRKIAGQAEKGMIVTIDDRGSRFRSLPILDDEPRSSAQV